MESIHDPDECWQAVLSRDRSQDGIFFFGVMTTGIYCRPSCPSRLPKRKNVRFYKTASQAEADGLRACLRCRPKGEDETERIARQVAVVCRHIEKNLDQRNTLSELAILVGLSPSHLQRLFKNTTGVSPKEYQTNAKLNQFKKQIRRGEKVARSVYAAGYQSTSRLYESIDQQLGMTPTEFSKGGKGVAISYAFLETRFGQLMMAATDRGVCFVHFGESREALVETLAIEYPKAVLRPMAEPVSQPFQEWVAAIENHMLGFHPCLSLPTDIHGTALQLMVWRYLQTIPSGTVCTYSDVANAIGKPNAVRAVASACGKNTVGIVIPCHRVIRKNGEMGGYRWGVALKQELLRSEKEVNEVKTQ